MVTARIGILVANGHRARSLMYERGIAAPAAVTSKAKGVGAFNGNHAGIKVTIQGDALLTSLIVEGHVVARYEYGLFTSDHEVLGLGIVPFVAL